MEHLKIAESEKKLTLSKYMPQFYVGMDGSYSSPGYNFHSDMNPNYAVYATVSMPLFEWGKRRNEKRASSFKMDMAAEKLGMTPLQIRLLNAVESGHTCRSMMYVPHTEYKKTLQTAADNCDFENKYG